MLTWEHAAGDVLKSREILRVSPWSGVDDEDGNFDLIHVEVDGDDNITHQYSTPKAKQEDEGSFGSELHLGVLLHIFVALRLERGAL
ncbi:hypothetical protein PsorP6_014159 [Peronosclerospora sorghi]|uniref:Uncharacterized protein n=1 Tax=Peronosclerospora sorghi TaxID=230839 RepID=A0ACC0VHL2_9STRA|nr:hypothetical protein PsorP6_014159 [Peronosclerospora sorghi]